MTLASKPAISDLLASARVLSVPMRVKFRGVTHREVVLFEGSHKWTEWSPFLEYEDDEANPFVVHLRERLEVVQVEATDKLEGWYSYSGVRYEICREQALEWFGGDEDAADDFVGGRFSISDMPRDVRAAEPAERVAWAAKKRVENEERSKAWFASLGMEGLL